MITYLHYYCGSCYLIEMLSTFISDERRIVIAQTAVVLQKQSLFDLEVLEHKGQWDYKKCSD